MRVVVTFSIFVIAILLLWWVYKRYFTAYSFAPFVSYPDYTVHEIPHFLSAQECDALIRLAKQKGTTSSQVYEPSHDGHNTSIRKSDHTWLRDEDDPVVTSLSHKVALLTSKPVSHQEELQVVHYGPGGKYEPHFDACIYDAASCRRMNGASGARHATVLIYLNDVEDGGGTTFPALSRTIRAERGKAVLFQNVDAATEAILLEAKHGGDPVKRGEKWVCNKWVHVRPFKTTWF